MSLKQAAVVINPASANGATGKNWPKIAAAIELEGLSFVHNFTKGHWDAADITRRYLQEGYELIIAVGGDGTANEVVNGFFIDEKPISNNAALGFISTGTGGDLGRTIGTPCDTREAVRHILNSPQRQVDVGRVTFINHAGGEEVRYFINVAGLGLDGDIVKRVNESSKAMGGFLSFLWGTLVSLALYKNQKMAVTVDDQLICDEPTTLVVVGNGRYFGGGMHAFPNAVVDDGLFDIIVLRNLGKINLLLTLPKVYRGTHLNNPRIKCLQGRKVKIENGGRILLNLDGEQPGSAPARIELLPLAINLKG